MRSLPAVSRPVRRSTPCRTRKLYTRTFLQTPSHKKDRRTLPKPANSKTAFSWNTIPRAKPRPQAEPPTIASLCALGRAPNRHVPRLIDDLATYHRQQNLSLVNIAGCNLEEILIQNNQVCQLAFFQRSFAGLPVSRIGRPQRIRFNGLLQRNTLLRKPPAFRLAV